MLWWPSVLMSRLLCLPCPPCGGQKTTPAARPFPWRPQLPAVVSTAHPGCLLYISAGRIRAQKDGSPGRLTLGLQLLATLQTPCCIPSCSPPTPPEHTNPSKCPPLFAYINSILSCFLCSLCHVAHSLFFFFFFGPFYIYTAETSEM